MMRKMRTRVQVALQPAAPGAPEPLPVAGMRLMTSVAAAWVALRVSRIRSSSEMTVTGCKAPAGGLQTVLCFKRLLTCASTCKLPCHIVLAVLASDG